MSSSSRRTKPLPRGWAKTRARILRRDAGICHMCGRPGATEVDHKTPGHLGGTDKPDNLAAIHTWCHAHKTGREARAQATHATRKRPTESHPGLVSAHTVPDDRTTHNTQHKTNETNQTSNNADVPPKPDNERVFDHSDPVAILGWGMTPQAPRRGPVGDSA